MSDEKRVIEGYEVNHAVQLAGGEVIFAINETAEHPYMVCDCSWDNPFGVNEYKNAVAGDDPVEMLREFVTRLSAGMDSIEAERAGRGIPFETLTAADCNPNSKNMDITGCVVVIKPESLSPEYRSIDHQLVLCTHGNGARPKAHGRSVFCKNLYDGKSARWDRTAIAGIILPERMPEWAREKLAAMQKPAEKESVIDKIREGKTQAGPEKPKNHKKDGPEL